MRKVAFILLPEFSNFGLAAATEPLFVANWLAQRTLFEASVVSADGKPVRASNGRIVPVDGDLGVAAGAKTVFVLASFDPRAATDELRVVRCIKRVARFGVEVGGIENGSLLMAKAGLLNGHQVAVHWDNLIGFQEHYPETKPKALLFCRSGERITCAGAAAILDMMIAWMTWHGEREVAREVAEHLLLGPVRGGDAEQRPTAAAQLDAAVIAAQTVMREHVDEPLLCGEIARRVGLSLRQLERRFRDDLQCTVLQHYRQLRMAQAHQLLQQTALPVTQVAFACGFSSPEYFCRLYRDQFGCWPSRDRRQSTTAPPLRARPQGVLRSRSDMAK